MGNVRPAGKGRFPNTGETCSKKHLVALRQARNAAFTLKHMLHTSCIQLYPLVAVYMYLVSATKMSPVYRASVAG